MILLAVSGALCGLGAFLILRHTATHTSRSAGGIVRAKLITKGREDRRILGITDEVFVARLLAAPVVGAIAATFALLMLHFAGVVVPLPLALLVLACGVVGPTAVIFERVSKQANAARRTFSYALSSYLDLASVLLAGGAGSETALNAAASTGGSWSFLLIREALENARAGRIPSWRVFGNLGRELGIVDLERLAGSMQLAGEQGAKVRTSLAAQADALRTRQISEIEADAQAATERMGVPTVLLFVGFIALLGYPALNLVVGQM